MKNTFDGFFSRLNIAKERIIVFKDKPIEVFPSQNGKRKMSR